MVAELRLWNQGRSEKEWTLEREELVVRSNCFRRHCNHGELDKWDDLSWQLKRYVGLYKPLAKIVTDGLCEAYDVQQTQNSEQPIVTVC